MPDENEPPQGQEAEQPSENQQTRQAAHILSGKLRPTFGHFAQNEAKGAISGLRYFG